jgi:sugar lactone lactonase YvrE
MTTRHPSAPSCRLGLALALTALAGCGGGGGGGTGTGGTGATGGTGGGACPTSTANGMLSIQISGTPSMTGFVSAGGQVIARDTVLTLAAGSYSVMANLVAEGGTTVRTAYTPVIDVDNPCVGAGQVTTVHVVYTAIETSGLVWTGVSNGTPNTTLLGYDPASVAVTGSTIALVAADTHGSDGFTFDPYGNIWVTGGTPNDPPVARYPAASFATSGAKTADFTLDSPSFGTTIPGPKVLTFDRSGDLWVSVVGSDRVVMFTPDQLVSSGTTAAAVVESGINAPYGVAFDFYGNMWVASNGDSVVVRIDAAHLATDGSGADFTITALTPSPVVGTLSHPTGLAFDGSGNLWVDYEGVLAMLPAATLGGVGALTVTPTTQLVIDAAALPTGMAFDEQMGLWLAYSVGKLARFSSTQLTGSGPATPATMITSSDLGSAGWFAIYPAPSATPLAHAFN